MLVLRRFSAYRRLEAHAEELRQGKIALEAAVAELTGQLSDQINRSEGVIHQLELERAKRIAAETVAAERGQVIGWLRELLAAAQSARDEATSDRLKSLDLVNSALLKPLTPEPAPDLSKFKPIPRQRLQAVTEMRNDDRRFMKAMREGKLDEYVKGISHQVPAAPPEDAASAS